MSTLSNLYISQSYQGLLHLGTNQSIAQSVGQGLIEIQDGLGVWMSASIDSNGNLYVANSIETEDITTNNIFVQNDLIVSGNLIVHDNVELKGNVDITGSVRITENLFVSGTIHAYEVITLIESSSVIFSSGSNVIGDSTSDIQTIVGQTTISGSLGVTGTQTNTGNLFVSNEISSSTINGIGNVELYSASVDSRLDYIEGPFSTSVDSRLDFLEGPFSTSVDSRLDYLEGAFSTSVDQRLDSIEFFTSSQEAKDITLAAYTGSVNNKFNAVGVYTSSMNLYTQSNDTRISNIENYTSSLRTAFTATGTDVNFNGNINVSGSITAYEIHTIIESASVIFSSGSNVLGDAVSDTQTLNGTVNIPNTLFVAGVEFIPFSQSVDSRLDQLEVNSGSVNNSISLLNSYTASNNTKWNTLGIVTASLNAFTASANTRITDLEIFSSSLAVNFITQPELDAAVNKLVTTSSFNAYTQSVATIIATAASTGSNTFRGNEIFSGSVRGVVTGVSISSNTASIDCSVSNFFTISLPATVNTHLTATNIQPGQTLQIRIIQNSTPGTITYSDKFRFVTGSSYTVSTIPNVADVLSATSFDTNYLYTVATKAF